MGAGAGELLQESCCRRAAAEELLQESCDRRAAAESMELEDWEEDDQVNRTERNGQRATAALPQADASQPLRKSSVGLASCIKSLACSSFADELLQES